MGATIIEAPSSTNNKAGERDPEMHQTKKGNQWHFGMKAHIGVDAKSGLTHSFTTTSANEHDLNQAENLLHGEEGFVFADNGYRGAEKREQLKGLFVDWHIAEASSKIKTLKKHPRINKTALSIEYMKASMRAKVEHPFRILKCQFGFTKTRYRGLMKNDGKLAMFGEHRSRGSDASSIGVVRLSAYPPICWEISTQKDKNDQQLGDYVDFESESGK